MMRKAKPAPEYAVEDREPRSEPVAPAEERDEIDELFTGGP